MAEKTKTIPQPVELNLYWTVRWMVVCGIAFFILDYTDFTLLDALSESSEHQYNFLRALLLAFSGAIVGGLQLIELPFRTERRRWFTRSATFTAIASLPAFFVMFSLPFGGNELWMGAVFIIIGFPVWQITTVSSKLGDIVLWTLAYWIMFGGYYLFLWVLPDQFEAMLSFSGENTAYIILWWLAPTVLPAVPFGLLTAYVLRGIVAGEDAQKAKR